MVGHLEASYAEMEQRVEERTKELVHSQKLLEERNEVIEEDLKAAKKVQAGLFPSTIPNIPFADISCRYQPVDQVGGDYYDIVKVNNKYGILIADVSGHGVPAAFLTTLTKIAFNITYQNDKDTAVVLKEMSNFMKNNILSDSFVTAFYGLYDPASGELVYSNAGHTAPIVYRANEKKCVPLKVAGGMPLGFLASPSYETGGTKLNVGDKILIYTDGLKEVVLPSGEMAGEKRIIEFMEPLCEKADCNEIAEYLMDSGDNGFLGGKKVSDDIALLLLARQPSSTLAKELIMKELNIAQVCSEVYSYLVEAKFASEDELLRVVLPLDEALHNAMLHGNLELISEEMSHDEIDLKKAMRLKDDKYSSRKVFLNVEMTGETLSITVGDEGPGMDPSAFSKPFTEEDMLKSHGRGMAIIKKFTDEVTFNERGNEITMSISQKNLKKLSSEPLPGHSVTEKNKILIIDDEEANVDLAKKILESEGYEVKESTDAFYGLFLVGEYNPDLVVLDLQMPDLDGAEICRRLKTNEATREIKILIVSANLPRESELLNEIMADEYLAKPIGVNELLCSVEDLLQ